MSRKMARKNTTQDISQSNDISSDNKNVISLNSCNSTLNFKFQISMQGSENTKANMEISGSLPSSSGKSNNLLPPIVLEGETSSSATSDAVPSTSTGSGKVMSKYHRGCATGTIRRTRTGNARGRSSSHSRSELNEETVSAYLDGNTTFLADYILKNVSLEILEKWMIRKVQTVDGTENRRRSSISRLKFYLHADKRKTLQEITETLRDHPTEEQVLWELGRCISAAVRVDGFYVFRVKLTEPARVDRLVRIRDGKEVRSVSVSAADHPIILEVARGSGAVRVCHFTEKTPREDGLQAKTREKYVMYQPLVRGNGETAAVLEMWRGERRFYEEDAETGARYIVWGGIALHYAKLYHDIQLQRSLADFLLVVVKSIFQNMISFEPLVTKVMNFAQNLVDADRASLFLVDPKTKELHATVFDVGSEKKESEDKKSSGSESSQTMLKEIRFPVGTGIAGHVAETGQVLNIHDAYEDPRFNRTVDRLTGYTTKTILCMPIYNSNSIIGVVQMVNKRNGCFTEDDVKAFDMFAVYCGLALHHAHLYNKISRSEQKYKVALEVLSYHNTCTGDEVNTALKDVSETSTTEMDNFAFSPFILDDYKKATHSIHMFIDLFGIIRFDRVELVKFVLTVRKNYRRVPYHNWTHGFSVANTMYNILKRAVVFTTLEKLALFIGCLCHDLDHRGKNNKYMSDTESPLAAIYSTSTMEHHHFNQTITILQQEGHNIFSKLSNEEYKDILSLLKHCILATDLAAFFPNKGKLQTLIIDQELQWNKMDHRSLILAVSMTAADLSAAAKPWEVQVETVKVIFQEFYQQGDEERAAGRPPMAMMDRDRPEEQAASQVGFLKNICLPCYELLHLLIPETEPLLTMCQDNLRRWEQIQEEVKQVLEKNEASALPSHLYIQVKNPK